ncbi:MAG: hypothetical protein J2P37_35420 [Ktedonobacteraceae bacterium]|nr:hypothetical protein [Ktedonobacteraceae bacterium]
MSKRRKRTHTASPQAAGRDKAPRVSARTSRARNRRSAAASSLLLTTLGIVVVGLIVFFGFRLISNTDTSPTSSTSQAPPISGNGKGGAIGTPAQKGSSPWSNQEFVSTVTSYAANKLHLSPSELTARVQGGMSFSDVAAQQGFSAAQIRSLELDALQAGLNKLISLKQRSQEMANADMEHWRQRDPIRLDADFTSALGGTPTIPKDQLTPSAQ